MSYSGNEYVGALPFTTRALFAKHVNILLKWRKHVLSKTGGTKPTTIPTPHPIILAIFATFLATELARMDLTIETIVADHECATDARPPACVSIFNARRAMTLVTFHTHGKFEIIITLVTAHFIRARIALQDVAAIEVARSTPGGATVTTTV